MGSPSVDLETYGTNAEPVKEAAAPAAEVSEAAPIKVDDLITLLQEVRKEKGNLIVSICVFHDETNSHSIDPVVGHYYQVDDNKVAQLLVLCDADHLQFAGENMELEESEVKPQEGVQ